MSKQRSLPLLAGSVYPQRSSAELPSAPKRGTGHLSSPTSSSFHGAVVPWPSCRRSRTTADFAESPPVWFWRSHTPRQASSKPFCTDRTFLRFAVASDWNNTSRTVCSSSVRCTLWTGPVPVGSSPRLLRSPTRTWRIPPGLLVQWPSIMFLLEHLRPFSTIQGRASSASTWVRIASTSSLHLSDECRAVAAAATYWTMPYCSFTSDTM